jgi:beta-xylosidase
MLWSTTLAALAGFAITSSAMPVTKSQALERDATGPILKREVTGPVIETDFPDPSIILVDGTWYAFGTQSLFDYKNIKTQLATSSDFNNWDLRENYDALRNLPSWVFMSDPKIWAPDVFQNDEGDYIMYFSAAHRDQPYKHCVGAAKSSTIEGPYDSVTDTPLACPLELGGAIDASSFQDDDGSRWMLYKDDGNAVGSGGECGNSNDGTNQADTWIVLLRMGGDGYTAAGNPIRILNRDPADGPLIEAPALARQDDGQYVLYFSSQCYTAANYDTSYAISDRITGGYRKAARPLLEFGVTQNTIRGPGGADVTQAGDFMAFHGYASADQVGKRRAMYVARPSYNQDTNTVSV